MTIEGLPDQIVWFRSAITRDLFTCISHIVYYYNETFWRGFASNMYWISNEQFSPERSFMANNEHLHLSVI